MTLTVRQASNYERVRTAFRSARALEDVVVYGADPEAAKARAKSVKQFVRK